MGVASFVTFKGYMVEVIRSKYIKRGNFLEATSRALDSLFWKSLMGQGVLFTKSHVGW